MYKSYLLKLLSFLAILIPPALVTGPFLPDFFISIMGLIFITLSINNFKEFIKLKFVLFFLIFYFLIIVSTILSYDPSVSLESTLFYFRFLFYTLVIFYILNNDKNFIKYFILSFTLTFALIYFDSVLQFFIGVNLTGYEYNSRSGINSFFGTNEDGILGSYIVRLTPIFCSLIAFKYLSNNSTKYIIISLLIGSSVISLLAQERATFFLSLIPIFLCIFCTNLFNNKSKIIFTVLIIILVISIILINQEVYTRFIISIKNQMFIHNEFVIFSYKHHAHYLSAIKMFFHEPLFGVGPKMFRHLCNENIFYVYQACSTHPHNTYIQLLAETGIFSFTFILLIFFYFLFISVRQFYALYISKKQITETHIMLLVSSIIISLWPITPTGNFFNNWLNVIYFLPFGFWLYFSKNSLNK